MNINLTMEKIDSKSCKISNYSPHTKTLNSMIIPMSKPEFQIAYFKWVRGENIQNAFRKLNADTARIYWEDSNNVLHYIEAPVDNVKEASPNCINREIVRLRYKASDRDYWKNRYEHAAKRIGEDILDMGLQGYIMTLQQSPTMFPSK